MTASLSPAQAASPTDRRPLRLGFAYQPGGSWPGAWLRGSHDPFAPQDITAVAQTAEQAGFDFVLFSDRVHEDGATADAHRPLTLPRTEPFTTASFVATRTAGIGLIVTANTSYSEPFNLARLTASLDHVTHGRAGWVVTTGITHPLAPNFSRVEPDPADHHARAGEVVGVIRKLWDSWEDDAFIRNKATGEYVDGDKIRPVNHQGSLFSIKGPLNVARPPQGHLVVAHQIGDPLSVALAAAEADLAFVSGVDQGDAIGALRDAIAQVGRPADAVLAFATVTLIIADTVSDAVELRADLAAGTSGGETQVPGTVIAGDAAAIADGIEAAIAETRADGLLIHLAFLPDQLDRFAAQVTPELQARGLLGRSGPPTTLRARLGLPAPANSLVAAA